MDSQIDGHKQRAASFDLIFFLIPNEWDNGKGFDYVMDVYNGNHRGISTDGSNWYKFRNHFRWSEEGIYSTETLSKELDLATSPKGNLSDKSGWRKCGFYQLYFFRMEKAVIKSYNLWDYR